MYQSVQWFLKSQLPLQSNIRSAVSKFFVPYKNRNFFTVYLS